MIQNAAAHAVEPVAGLRFAGQIIHERAGCVRVNVPAFFPVERQKVIRIEQRKLSCADFLVIIAWQRQRKFRDERQKSAEAIRAETVGVHAGAGGQARIKTLLAFWQRLRQRGLGPKQMRLFFELAVAVETIRAGMTAKMTLIPNGQFHREWRKQRWFDAAPAQSGAHAEIAVVAGQLKRR